MYEIKLRKDLVLIKRVKLLKLRETAKDICGYKSQLIIANRRFADLKSSVRYNIYEKREDLEVRIENQRCSLNAFVQLDKDLRKEIKYLKELIHKPQEEV